jgi:hypothetical protein
MTLLLEGKEVEHKPLWSSSSSPDTPALTMPKRREFKHNNPEKAPTGRVSEKDLFAGAQ